MPRYPVFALGAVTAAAVLALMPLSQAQAQAQNRNLTIVLTDEPTDLDGCNTSQSTVGRVVKQTIAETLTVVDPDTGAVTPRLATSWERIDDFTWRFKLRPNVTFHDGTPFNATTASGAIARTLVESITPVCGVRTKFFGAQKLTGKAVDPLTLDITSSVKDPILPTRMGVYTLVHPDTSINGLQRTAIGTGPYVLEKWTNGIEITLKRNESYWGKKPEATAVKFVWRKESAVRAAMVKVGEADLTDNIAVQDANDPKTDFSFLNSETSFLRIDTMIPPLNNFKVRQALQYATDRNALRGSILSKDVIPAAQVVLPFILGHNHELDKKPIPFDLAKAKQLVAEAKAEGADLNKELEMVGRTGIWPNGTETMEALMEMYKAAGFKVKLKMLDRAEWLDILNKPFKDERGPVLLQGQHDNNNGDSVFTVEARYACKGVQSTICDPALDAKIAEAATLIGPARVKAYEDIYRIVYEEKIPDVYLFHMVGYTRVNPRINFKPNLSLNSEIGVERITFN